MRDYRDILKSELQRRTEANPLYSLRAFARDLKIAPSRLSEVLNERRGLSEEAAARVARRLGLTGLARDGFVASVEAQHARSAARKTLAAGRLKQIAVALASASAEPSYYIVAWYVAAAREAARLKGYEPSAEWLAGRLGIQTAQAELALDYLARVGKKSQKALRIHHGQVLDLAKKAPEPHLLAQPLALDAAGEAKLRRLIAAFHQNVKDLAAESRGRDRLVMLGTQLFRIDTP